MKLFRPFMFGATALIISITPRVYGQCSFTPTISPAAPIFCFGTMDTLHTETYDAYQWYRNGSPIAGATSNFLVIDVDMDAGSYFLVEATLAACTEKSDSTLVDAWMFLPPVASTNPFPVYTGGSGEAYYCNGDTAFLQLLNPLVNIQWFKDGSPIAGANNNLLEVTTNGDYTATANYAMCPNQGANLGVEIPIRFLPDFIPTILVSGSDIYTPDGTNWQWFLAGNPVVGATDSILTSPAYGTYYVTAVDTNGCEGQSANFIVEPTATEPVDGFSFGLYPNPAGNLVKISTSTGVPASFMLTDLSGKVLLTGKQTSQFDVTEFSNGIYMLTVTAGNKKSSKKLIISH